MRFEFKWADYRELVAPNFFSITMRLAQIERVTRMEYQHTNVLRDSIHWSRRYEYPWAFITLSPYSKNEIILDVGCDCTPFQFLLADVGGKVYSLDHGQDSIDAVQSIKGARSIDNIFPILGDACHMDFPSAFFDKTVVISTLEHIPKNDIENALAEIIRVTKPEGKIVISMDIVTDKNSLVSASPQSQLDLVDLTSLARRYSFGVPPQLPTSMTAWCDNLLLAVACIEIQLG